MSACAPGPTCRLAADGPAIRVPAAVQATLRIEDESGVHRHGRLAHRAVAAIGRLDLRAESQPDRRARRWQRESGQAGTALPFLRLFLPGRFCGSHGRYLALKVERIDRREIRQIEANALQPKGSTGTGESSDALLRDDGEVHVA